MCRAGRANSCRKPKHIDFDTAASVPVAALTAWQEFLIKATLPAVSGILITGASGQRSMAVQLRKQRRIRDRNRLKAGMRSL